MINKIQEIKNQSGSLVEMIKQYSRDQKELWQKVPYLALHADGKSGYSDQYSRAYRTGYWALDSSTVRGYYNIFIDLSNGDLVNARHELKIADPEHILKLAFNLEELDATDIVDELIAEGKSLPWKGYNKQEQEKWRKGIIKEYNLKKKYTLNENYQRKS